MESPIGLFGGTFSPVHHGHLRSALDICQALELSSVTLIPNYQSPHKAAQDVSAQHRLAMLKLATSISPMLNISDIEISSANTSYTVDTVRSFRAQYPDRPLCFLMGMDSLINFTKWHQWQEILANCHLIVSKRPGYDVNDNSDAANLLSDYQTTDIAQIKSTLSGRIFVYEAHPLAISSSQMREAIKTGKAITYLTPPAVEDYIATHQLYC